MLIQETTRHLSAAPADQAVLTELMAPREAGISDAPLYTPEGIGLLLLLLSPKEPKDRPAPKRS